MKFVKLTRTLDRTKERDRPIWVNLDKVSVMFSDRTLTDPEGEPRTKIVFYNTSAPFNGIRVKETPEQIFAMEAIDSLTAEVTSDDWPIELGDPRQANEDRTNIERD